MKMRKTHIFSSLAIVFLLLMLLAGTSGCLSVQVFHRLAIEPNDQGHEFVQGQGMELYEGSYLGTEVRQDRRMHHYCFEGILKGDGRKLHVCIDADGYGQAVAFEDDACDLPEVAPAYLVFRVISGYRYPKGTEGLAVKIQELSVPGDHPAVLCASDGPNDTIRVFLLQDMSENGVIQYYMTWEGPIDVDWKVRSKTMAYIRPIYALPVALLCLPVDIICVPFILPFLPYLIDAADC
ncbi:MAG: hypothetical protein J5654_11770 [Victivallales bacterium]|nr:hypothetical protein [Victivallales bacterium]